VAISRAQEIGDIAFDFSMTTDDLRSIGSSTSWREQHEEVERILLKATEHRAKMAQDGVGTDTHFASQLKQLCEIALQKATQHTNLNIRTEVQSCVVQWLESIRKWEETRMDTS
jgi:hypothetical protein